MAAEPEYPAPGATEPNSPRAAGELPDASADQGDGRAGQPGTGEQSEAAQWTKLCRKCSVQSSAAGEFCPNCGASYQARKRIKMSKKAVIILLAVIVLGGAAAGVALGVQHSQEVAAEEAAAAKAKAAAAASAKEKARQVKAAEAAETAERALRAIIVTGLEEAVQKDAVKRVDEGRLTGPIERTECTPLGGGSVDDLTAITGTFECISVNEKHEDGSESGYVFSATVNWDAASYSWHLGR